MVNERMRKSRERKRTSTVSTKSTEVTEPKRLRSQTVQNEASAGSWLVSSNLLMYIISFQCCWDLCIYVAVDFYNYVLCCISHQKL